MSNINVLKRDGTIEDLNLEKVHKMVEFAVEGLAGVSASQVEIQSGLQFCDGIKSSDIQEILIRSASDLISEEHPNYQYVAARLLLFGLRKAVHGHPEILPPLSEHIKRCVDKGVYDGTIVNRYSEEEWNRIDSFVDHERDYLFTYAGLRQVVDKYLVQDRSTGEHYESPQQMYIMIAATLFANYPTETRLDYVRRYYNAISTHKINIPTPIMGGVRTPIRQFASCVLLILMTPSIVSLAVIWLLANMSHSGLVLGLTRAESVASTVKSGVAKYNTQVLSPSLKSSRQLLDAVRKTVSEEGQPLYTFQSGIKKLKTSLFSRTTKGRKTTE